MRGIILTFFLSDFAFHFFFEVQIALNHRTAISPKGQLDLIEGKPAAMTVHLSMFRREYGECLAIFFLFPLSYSTYSCIYLMFFSSSQFLTAKREKEIAHANWDGNFGLASSSRIIIAPLKPLSPYATWKVRVDFHLWRIVEKYNVWWCLQGDFVNNNPKVLLYCHTNISTHCR